MSPRRNIGEQPTRPRHIARVGSAVGPAEPVRETPSFAHLMSTGAVRRAVRAFAPALALAVSGLTVACADGPTAPAGAAAPTRAPALSSVSAIVSTDLVGDTTVTVFVVGTNTSSPASFNIGNSSRIEFPYATASVCELGTSSYGATEWDKPCAASKTAVEVTARTWVNARGKLTTDFQPRMRFVPGLRKGVTLTLKDAAKAGTRVDFCTPTGCVDEAAADPSLAPVLDPRNGFVTRLVKHFSGYTVVAN